MAEAITVDLKELSPEIHNALEHVRNVAYSDGDVAGKHKLLVALAIAASVKCEPCVRMYAEKAVKAGASLDEAVEILNVTMAMGGCVGEAWVQKALVAFENFRRKRPTPAAVSSNPSGSCCSA
jgi:AhpD family alkylhydroperoxidase